KKTFDSASIPHKPHSPPLVNWRESRLAEILRQVCSRGVQPAFWRALNAGEKPATSTYSFRQRFDQCDHSLMRVTDPQTGKTSVACRLQVDVSNICLAAKKKDC